MKWGRIIRRGILVWIVTTISICVLSWIMRSFSVDNVLSAAAMAAVFGLLNALVWPFLIWLALPLTVLTMGLGVLLLNACVVMLSSSVRIETVSVDNYFSALIVAFGITLINTILLAALSIEDDDFFYLNVVKRNLRKNKNISNRVKKDQRGVFFLEIDGLAHDVLLRAITDGNAPNMSKWLRDGTHKLIKWETDWSSQTSAMQAGILHGNNSDIPAFRWWDKKEQRSFVSNRPKDAMEIEANQSNGKGLLAHDGASRANLLSGDAPHSLLTMSTVLRKDRKGRIGQDYYTFFANPYNLLRTIILTVYEVFQELWQARQQKKLDVVPRVHRGFVYSLLRAWTTTVQRDLQVQAIIGDL